ncbi:hypothetical protein [Paracidovorax avenae]|uniref:hypothetical protein n=1 Tax=Paracidovorax avenae TaxID=80867 RepID=UPI001864216F|nr:hypothetical protein [Paracidovorax avenae]
MALDFRIRNLLRNDEVCPFVPALGTAEAQRSLPLASHQNSRIAICAGSHFLDIQN